MDSKPNRPLANKQRHTAYRSFIDRRSGRNLFGSSSNHQITLGIGVPCQSIFAFLKLQPLGPRDGAWQFRTTSDDGSRLFIDGDRVVDNDGAHAAISRSGYRRLAAGLHAIRIEYFDQGGPDELKLYFSGPGQPWTEMPASVFRHR